MWNNDSPVQNPVIPKRCTNIDTNCQSFEFRRVPQLLRVFPIMTTGSHGFSY